jgi:hypothetical protein
MKLQWGKIKSLLILFPFLLSSFSAEGKVRELYISLNGNDNNSGTQTAPLRSLEKARDAVRLIRTESPDDEVIVYLNGGTYFLEEPVTFDSDDSGSEDAPVIYKAVDGEEPVFTGSKAMNKWKKLKDKKKLSLLASPVHEKVYVADLKEAGIQDFGDPTELGKRPELFCNGKLQTLARWPNEGFAFAGQSRGKTELLPTYIKKRGTKEGDFEYLDKRQDRWTSEKDIHLGGYWYWDWSDEFQAVERIDTLTKTIFIREPYHRYGYKDSLRYFGLNLYCEIDQPGEWYLDRTEGLLYWYPPEEVNPAKAEVTLSLFNAPYMIEMKNCSYLTLEGLTFREGRGSAILISEGKNCRIADCRIERFGCDGIHIEEGSGHGISGCMLRTFGCSGIDIKGGDRKGLIPARHFVEHTVVENFSLFKRTYEPAVHLEGCGIRVSNNRFRNSSSSAMRLEGNDFVIEYNEVSHVVNESDDQGGIDMWYNPSYRGNVIRFNRWSDIYGGTRHGAAGVRLDDMISGVSISGNIFERCGSRAFGGVQIHGGKDNIVENNLFYDCFAAVSFSPWGEKRWLKQLDSPVIRKKIYEDVNIRSRLYQERYPELKNIRLNPDVNTIKNNLLVGCNNRFIHDNNKQIVSNNTVIQAGGKTIEELCTPEVLSSYGLQPIPLQKIGPKKNKWIK